MKSVYVAASPYLANQIRFCLITEQERKKAREEASCGVKALFG